MYSLLDDEDEDSWEARRREIAELGALLPPEGGDFAGLDVPIPPPYAAYQPPPPAQMAPLEVESGPDWTDALNVGLVGLGGLVDLAANKGRNFGAIAASGAHYGAERAGQRVAQEKDRLAYEERRAQLERQNAYNDLQNRQLQYRMQHDVEQGARADRRIGISAQNAATGERKAELSETKEDPSELIAWAAERGFDLSGLETMGQARAALGPLVKQWELETADDRAAAAERGRTTTEIAMSPVTTAVAANRARAIGEATEPVETRKIRAGAIAKADADRQVAGEKSIANADIGDPNVWSTVAGTPKLLNDANETARARVVFKKAMDDMAAIQARAGVEVLPSADKAAYQTAQAGAIGSLTTLFQTGVINEQEYRRYIERIPEIGISPGAAMGGVTGQNVVGQQIAATRDELLGIFGAALSQYGLKPPSGRGSGGGGVFRAGSGRAQAQGTQPMPGGTMNAPQGAREYTVSMPGQPTVRKTLTPDLVERLRAAGAMVQ